MSYLRGNGKTNNRCIMKSLELNGKIVENILALLRLKDFSISELLFEIQTNLPYLYSYKTFKKCLAYLADYELISYNAQIHMYRLEDAGIDLLNLIAKEKKRSIITDSKSIPITIERGV